MELKRYVFGYRGRWGVEQAEVEASALAGADTVARAWCEAKGHRFLWVRDPVVARENEVVRATLATSPTNTPSELYSRPIQKTS